MGPRRVVPGHVPAQPQEEGEGAERTSGAWWGWLSLLMRRTATQKYIYVVPIYIDLSIITVWCSPRKGQERCGSIWHDWPEQDPLPWACWARKGVRPTSERCAGGLGF